MENLISQLLVPFCGITYQENTCQQTTTYMLIQRYSSVMNPGTLNKVYNVSGRAVTPLEAAVTAALPDMVSFMLQMGADPNFSSSGVPIIYQLQRGNNPRVNQILDILSWYNPQLYLQQPWGYPYQQGYGGCSSCNRPRHHRR